MPPLLWQQLLEERNLALRAALQQAASAAQQTELISRLHKRHFAACDALLDQAGHGPLWLREARIAEVLV